MKYKVHVAYISSITGAVISAGIYEETDIDVAEARNKSIITLSDIPDQTSSLRLKDDIIKVKRFDVISQYEMQTSVLEPTVEIKDIKLLKINSASVKEIADYKYVSKKNAETVIRTRENEHFKSYEDLNNKVPLGFNRKWEDIAAIDFEIKTKPEDNHLIFQ